MNPYKQWLGIATNGQPDHFQLLGVSRDEQDLDTIKAAARFQVRKTEKHRSGEHTATAEQLLVRIKKAYRVVSHPDLREDYLELLARKEREVLEQREDQEIVVPIGQHNVADGNSTVMRGLIITLALSGCLLALLTFGGLWMAGVFNRSNSQTQSKVEPSRAASPTEATPVTNGEFPGSTALAQATEKTKSSNGTEEGATKKSDTAATETDANSPIEASIPELSELALKELDKSQKIQLAHQAMAVLKSSCYSCHGEAGEDEGGFGFVLDREELVSSGHVVPRNPDESVLMQRIVSADSPMPPEGEEPRPNSDQIEIVNRWILAGAPGTSKLEDAPYVSPSALYAAVAADLKQVEPRERKFIRYFAISHLANAGASAAELETNRQALAKLLNSLSWKRKLAKLKPLENQPTVFQIDLRDLKWTEEEWKHLMLDYPYGVIIESDDLKFASDAAECEIPILRGDWFVATASRPPLYHELLKIPSTDLQLEELLQVNVKQNIREFKAQRIGFARSGVSQNNRMIERHDSAVGAYWKSYDFGGNTGRKNLFENPLGPGRRSSLFQHDGGEIIFQLPNGMLGYMLTDAEGQRIDRGPTEIVSDPRQPDRAVVNGVSCMSCHYGGFIQKADEIRGHVVSNPNAFKRAETIKALYPEPKQIDPKLAADTKKYLVALASDEVGIEKPTRNGEPVVLVSNRFGGELDATLASAELGMSKADFIKALVDLGDDDLARTVGVLRLGGVVKRETFEDVFMQLVDKLKLGRAPQLTSSAAARRRVAARNRANLQGVSGLELQVRNFTAQLLLNEGAKAISKKRWADAIFSYEKVIRSTPDPDMRLKAYKKLIPIYERIDVPQKLIDAHKFVLNSIPEPKEMVSGVEELFVSLVRQQSNQDSTKNDHSSKKPWSDILIEIPASRKRVVLPTSTGSKLKATFESELKKDPLHEPALLVLNSLYSRVGGNDIRLKDIFERLVKLRVKRGEAISANTQVKLAHILMSSGDFHKAAELYASVNQGSSRSASSLSLEASAWERAYQMQKATSVLKELIKTDVSTSQKSSIADALVRCGDPESAIMIYVDVLKISKDKHRIKQLQQNLSRALALSKNSGPATTEAEELLDPLREFRIAAEELEKEKHTDQLRNCKALVDAAKSWHQANAPKKALSAMDRAAELLATAEDQRPYRIESLHRKVGEVYHELKENDKALRHFSVSIRLADSKCDIEKDQRFIKRLLVGDNPIEKTDEVKLLISLEFKYGSLASQIESKLKPGSQGDARKKLQATEYWAKAKNVAGVTRCGRLAAAAIKESNDSDKFSYRRDLANFYMEIQLDNSAAQQYVLAMDWADDDDEAVELYSKVITICQRNNLPLPKLKPLTEAKLDPLNRFRVTAMKKEVESRGNPKFKRIRLQMALENWLKAGEEAKASETADKVATAILNEQKQTSYASNCATLAKCYLQLDNKISARKFYQLAIENEEDGARKARFQDKLDALDK